MRIYFYVLILLIVLDLQLFVRLVVIMSRYYTPNLESNMYTFSILLFLIYCPVHIQSVVDTTICPVGFAITQANRCDSTLGPCATTDYVASTSTFATQCLTCFPDA
jgi:hypothetical protein